MTEVNKTKMKLRREAFERIRKEHPEYSVRKCRFLARTISDQDARVIRRVKVPQAMVEPLAAAFHLPGILPRPPVPR